MEAARRRLWLRAGLAALAVCLLAAGFSAYLRPDMLASFNDLMALCAALLR